jgi:site-specific recombinase XerD
MVYTGFYNAEKLTKFFYIVKNRHCLQTARTYSSVLEKFFKWVNKDFSRISNQDVDDYIECLLVEMNYSQSYYNQFISAFIKFKKISYPNKRFKTYLLNRPKKEHKLPEVLSEQEIISILKAIENVKHKAIIAFIYSHGLRISECQKFRLTDFDKERGIIHVREAKGKKDREVPFNENCRTILTNYIKNYRPENYLFEGENELYSKTSIRNILNRAVGKAGIAKSIHVHTLRHSYATHLHEQGIDTSDIQKILGHKRITTTQIYTRISTKYLSKIQLKTNLQEAA